MMNRQGKSDRPEVPGKSPNNAGQPGAEGMEGSGLAKGNLLEPNASRTPSRPDAPSALEFGPFAVASRKRRGEGKPETFNFLGFTHICGKKRSGRFTVVRQTMRKRLQAKMNEVKTELRRRLHHSLPEVGQWLLLGGRWALPLLWSAHEQTGAAHLPVPDRIALASRAFAAQSEGPSPLGPHAAADSPLAPSGSHLP